MFAIALSHFIHLAPPFNVEPPSFSPYSAANFSLSAATSPCPDSPSADSGTGTVFGVGTCRPGLLACTCAASIACILRSSSAIVWHSSGTTGFMGGPRSSMGRLESAKRLPYVSKAAGRAKLQRSDQVIIRTRVAWTRASNDHTHAVRSNTVVQLRKSGLTIPQLCVLSLQRVDPFHKRLQRRAGYCGGCGFYRWGHNHCLCWHLHDYFRRSRHYSGCGGGAVG